MNDKKVTIVHDWLYGGGAERVVLELHRMFPDAPIYTSYCSDEWRAKLDGKVVTGYLQKWPFNKLRKFIPFLRIKWFESLDLSQYDLVISSSGNGEAKGVKAGSKFRQDQTHVCYCHSPVHFYWRHYDQYLATPGFGILDSLVRVGLKLLVGPLRKWDLKASKRPDHYIANSNHIRADIKRFYDRDSTVIFPPVDIERFKVAADPDGHIPRQGFLAVGRQVPFKRFDLIIKACSKLNRPLTVIGRGPEHEHLKSMAGPSVNFITGKEATDEVIASQMRHAQAFIFASHEDFGIVPIEAMAAGTPVIAYRAGGALDYVRPGVTGEFFAEQTVDSLVRALKAFNPQDYDPEVISRQAGAFSDEHFRQNLTGFLANTLD